MIPLGPVVARSRVGVARAAAWTYLVEPDRRAEWWPELQLDARVGGAVSERWSEGEGESAVSRDAAGAVDVWVEGHAVGFTWRESGDERDTAVLITLRTQGVDTGITVTETGFDALPAAAERAAASQDGWQVLLRDLTAALEAAQAAGAFGEGGAVGEGVGVGAAVGFGAGAGAEIALVEPEIDGEIEFGDADALPEADGGDPADAPAIEVEAEPQVGDHPELETGPVPIVAPEAAGAAADAADAAPTVAGDDAPADDTSAAQAPSDEAPADQAPSDPAPEDQVPSDPAPEDEAPDETIRIDRSELDGALAGGEDLWGDARQHGGQRASNEESPEEPDFDTLIRGN